MHEQVFSNARIVLADSVISGNLRVKNGHIDEICEGQCNIRGAIDLEGDLLLPGFIELHTDNLDKHMTPRPKTEWPSTSAAIAHDNQIAASGITTVLDAVALGDVHPGSSRLRRLNDMITSICKAADEKLFRAEHFLHFRCEISYPDLPDTLEPVIDNPRIRLISVMDHTPGQRQFVSLDAYYTYYQSKYGMSDSEMETFVIDRKRDQQRYSRKHRQLVVDTARAFNIALASHDDATKAHVAEAVEDNMSVAEFPTTHEAAEASHKAGLCVMMGGPNIVRGKSHSGNVSARELAEAGYLDVISSDYVPHSLLYSAMMLFNDFKEISLPHAIRLISKNPAKSIGLNDRGEIAEGLRADLVHVHHSPHHPVIRGVWSRGRRIA